MLRPRFAAAAATLILLPLGVAGLTTPAGADKKSKDAAQPQSKYNLSKPVQTALAAAQDAFTKKDYATVNTHLAEADAALSTPDDRLITGKMHLQVAVEQKDAAGEAKYVAVLLALPNLSAEERIHYLHAQVQLAAEAKDTATERSALQALAQAVPTDANTWLTLGDLDSAQKNYTQALADTEKGVDLLRQANQPVEPALMHNLFAYAHNSRNAAAIAKYAPQLVAADPSPQNWTLVIDDVASGTRLDEQTVLDLYRLRAAVGAMEGSSDWLNYADLASRHGLPGEAVAALDTAKQKGVRLNSADESGVRGPAAAKLASDRASLPGLEAAARNAPTGRKAQGLGDGYLEYGQNQKAAEFYQLALQKGGADVDAATVQTRLGIVLARAGQKDQAKAAFAKVTGPRQGIAALWSLAVDHPAAAA